MTDSLIATVERHLAQLPNRRPELLVALSGGLDSTVLLHALWRLRQRGRIERLEALHVDHRLRQSSSLDRNQCQHFTSTHDIPLTVVELSPSGTMSQDAARRCRLAALANGALRRGITTIALAHHADDRVETALLNARRGTGLTGLTPLGLSAPFPLADIPMALFRPLIDQHKSDLRRYAERHALAFAVDPTNQEATYRRNQLRLKALPHYLASRSDRRGFLRTLDNLDSHSAAVTQRAAQLIEQCCAPDPLDVRGRWLRLPPLRQAPPAEVNRLLLDLFPQLHKSHLDRLREGIHGHRHDDAPHHLTLPGLLCTFQGQRLRLVPAFQRGASDRIEPFIHALRLGPPAGQASFFDFRITWSTTDQPGEPPGTPWRTTIPCRPDTSHLKLGPPAPGATVRRTEGSSTYTQGLRTWLASLAVEPAARRRWPCLYDEQGSLLWVAGRPRRAITQSPPHGHHWQIQVTPPGYLHEKFNL